MKNLKRLMLGSVLVLCLGSAAQSQVIIDMSKLTCAQLNSGTTDSIEASIWLSGYYNGLRKNTKLDLAQLKQNAATIGSACQQNPNLTVVRMIEVLQKRKK